MPPPILERQLSRFTRLPESQDVWEGAIVALPTWVDAPDGPPYRPRAVVWASTSRQLVNLKMVDAAAEDEVALAAFAEMGTSAKLAGYRPRAVRVQDERFADMLREPLDSLAISIAVVDKLPAVVAFVDALVDSMEEPPLPAALDAPGVTPARLAAFADAAKRFFDAAPWRHLQDADLIKIEEPKAGRGLALCGVLGSAGEVFGLGFFSSVTQYHQIMDEAPIETILEDGGEWAVYFSPPWETAFGDLDAWETLQLPLASDLAYPTAIRLHPSRGPQRPDAGRLAYIEGLLRVLADTTEAEMDSGRWSRTVPTAEGEQTYVLALPNLLDALPESPPEQAEDLIDAAFDAAGRRQLQLIRRVLALSPDCADAYFLLAERTSDPSEARAFYEQAVAAGERALGPNAFTDPDREFWGDVSTRPYMRARAGLAECLLERDDIEPAVAHFRALLQLNPLDNQGIRYRLLTTMLLAERNADAEALLKEYGEDGPRFQYAGVLLALRAKDHRLARHRLRAALKWNRRVPAYLIGRKNFPVDLPSFYGLGSEEEAVLSANDLIGPWSSTPGAVEWLRAETRKGK